MSVLRDDMRRRLDGLEARLRAAGPDAVVITHLPNVRYLTGFSGSSAVLVHVHGGGSTLITDSRYGEQAASEVPSWVRVHVSAEGWIDALAGHWDGSGPEVVGFEPEALCVREHERLRERIDGAALVPVPGLVAPLRAVKSPVEVGRIAEAGRLAEDALGGLLAGMDWTGAPTEIAIAARLELELRERGSERHPFETIVAAGARASLPHARPSNREVERGDLLLVDFGATVDGYCSDMTRTFVIGAPAEWQTELHARVLEAQAAAIAVAGAGVPAVEVDAAARDTLTRYGLGEAFGHSTGHGVGLEIHEDPRVSSRSADVLKAGNVVTVEPGVYLPGRGGVRIEDDIAVTEDGCRVLTSAPRDLLRL